LGVAASCVRNREGEKGPDGPGIVSISFYTLYMPDAATDGLSDLPACNKLIAVSSRPFLDGFDIIVETIPKTVDWEARRVCET